MAASSKILAQKRAFEAVGLRFQAHGQASADLEVWTSLRTQDVDARFRARVRTYCGALDCSTGTEHKLIHTQSDQTLRGNSSKRAPITVIQSFSKNKTVREKALKPLRSIAGLLRDAKQELLTAATHLIFKESDDPPNHQFMGNYAPVPEIGERVPIQVVAGAVPTDFPPGVYIRNGGNPQFGAKRLTSPFGVVDYHMFEADGMLHATYFQEGGQVSYLNRYVCTKTYIVEKEKGMRTWMPSIDGDFSAIALSYLFNTMRFGKVRVTANTHVFKHAGKYYAIAEGDFPHEFNLSDLTTVAVWDGCNGSWNLPNFTAHPCHDPQTQELVFSGMRLSKPYAEIGIWSADGERLVHRIDLGLDRCVLAHDIAITQNYTLFFDFPLVLDMDRLKNGGRIIEFQADCASRVGILPRYGDTNSIRWFPVQTGYSWHKLNSYEDGDEVVVIGLWSRRPILTPPVGSSNEIKSEWWARGALPIRLEDAEDPEVDGALWTYIHEWRFNMHTGEVSERNLSDFTFSGEYPCINRSYGGIKNKFGYMCLGDIDESVRTTTPIMKGWVKMMLPQSAKEDMEVEMHDLGPGWGASEPSFVARPNAQTEDDGWILGYVHNTREDASYLYILDAQNFTKEPVAKLKLPQRVPYGFHGTYFSH